MPANGKKKWSFLAGTGELRSSPAIGPDGVIYFGSQYGVLYAIQGIGSLAPAPWPKFKGDAINSGRATAPSTQAARFEKIGFSRDRMHAQSQRLRWTEVPSSGLERSNELDKPHVADLS
jgi:hypothetical protein